MTNVNSVGILSNSVPATVYEPKKNNNKVVAFKAYDNRDQFVRQPQMISPQEAAMQRAILQQQKEAKKQKTKQNIITGVSVASGLAIIAMVLMQMKAMKGGGKEQLNQLVSTNIKWTDFKGQKRKTAPLDSATTNKKVAAQYKQIINNTKLSSKAKEWSGLKDDGADIIYAYGYGGTGKTYSTKQFAEELEAIYTCIKYPDLGSPFKDAASMKADNTFNQIIEACKKNPDRMHIVCIDESDAVIQKVMENTSGTEEARKLRSAVITGIDRIKTEAPNCKLILTSNYHPESGAIDDVIKRRINKIVEVALPDAEQAEALLKMYLGDIKAIKPEFYNSPEFKKFVNKLIEGERHYSGAEIEAIAKEAAKDFGSTLKGVADDELAKHPFIMKYLEDALSTKGKPAALTNTTMLTAAERAGRR